MNIYAVARSYPVHNNCCPSPYFGKKYERVRTTVAGMYLEHQNAVIKAIHMNKEAGANVYFVVKWKIKDAPCGGILTIDGDKNDD